MVSVRHGSPRYRAFWMTAGLTAGAATWAFAIEPVAQQVVLQPVPNSNVVQTQAQAPANSGLRTQQPGAGQQGVRQAVSNQPKSDVQRKLEELYANDGREMPVLPDPQIQRQTPGQTGSPKPAGTPAQPVSQSTAAQVRTSAGAQPSSAQPQYKTWAEAQTAGDRSTQGKKTPWIEQINPFKKRVPSTPPTEPAEIHYDPRHAGATGGTAAFQPQGQVVLQPGQINPQTGRPNYGQIFNQPQTYGAPMTPPQGDPFVATPPMAVAATPQLTAPGQPAVQQPIPQQQPAAILFPPAQAQAAPLAPANPAAAPTPVAALPVIDFTKPVPAQAPAAAPVAQSPTAAPAPAAAPGGAFPVIDFTTPVPMGAAPAAQPTGVPAIAATPATATPQIALAPAQPAAPPIAAVPAPPAEPLSPFTGIGLNDDVPPLAVTPAPQAAVAPALPPMVSAQPVPAAATLPPLVVAEAPKPVAAPPVAAAPQAPTGIPKLDGFFSEEEDRGTPSAEAVALPAQPKPLVVPAPAGEQPQFEVPKAADVAALPMPSIPSASLAEAAPMPAALPKLELPPIVESTPAPAPAAIATTPSPDVVQPGSVPPLKPVPRQADPNATTKMARIAARADQRGLKGFCPVMLRDHRDLVDSRAEYRSFYRNRIILLSSQEAKVVFESDPAKYAPASAGNDVIHLAQTGEELEGTLDYAVWYKGRLYLFASAETLETFVAAPSSHATND